jgi:predicted DCC family thiol-disulfide oxidoreductase YuxK
MISLISEITDAKGRCARAGWIFYDADCPFCVSTVRRLARFVEPRGFGLDPLQDPRAEALLNAPRAELLAEMRLVTADGRQFGGADALVRLCREVWWAWPLVGLAQLPGVMSLARRAYRRFASRRSCAGGACTVTSDTHKRNQEEFR